MWKYLDDIFFVCGSGILVYATFQWSIIGAWYVAGAILIIAGVIVGIGAKVK